MVYDSDQRLTPSKLEIFSGYFTTIIIIEPGNHIMMRLYILILQVIPTIKIEHYLSIKLVNQDLRIDHHFARI